MFTSAQVKFPIGVYSGNGGLWYFKSDSTFIFLADGISKNYINEGGVGKWQYIGDSVLAIQFEDFINQLVFDKDKIEYHAETKYSLDTIYLSGRAIGKDGKPCSFMSIQFTGTKYVFSTDKDGYFKVKYHFSRGFHTITFIKRIPPNYYPVKFELSPFNNVHVLNITIPLVDSLSFIPKEKSGKQEMGYTQRRPRSPWGSIDYMPGKVAELKKILIDAQTKQPLYKRYFAELLRRIEE